MILGTTREGQTVEMERVRGPKWRLTIDGEQWGTLQSFAACVILSWRLIPVNLRAV
ncbi:MAG: hypothetical protein NUW01_13655 [Gemmatimonadaceae bacterium]|nr:hypothetical protein [Gemmatimonadaceae bacterium]